MSQKYGTHYAKTLESDLRQISAEGTYGTKNLFWFSVTCFKYFLKFKFYSPNCVDLSRS